MQRGGQRSGLVSAFGQLMVAASGGDDGGFVCCPTVGVLCAVRVSSDPWAVFAASAAGGRAACGDAFIIFLRVFGASVASHESWYVWGACAMQNPHENRVWGVNISPKHVPVTFRDVIRYPVSEGECASRAIGMRG